MAAGEARQGNYSVSYVPADFTIRTNNEDLGLTAENGGGEYNANPYYLNDVKATGKAAEGSKIEYKVGDGEWSEEAPSRTDAGTLEGISVRVSKAGYETIQVIEKLKIEVTPKPVTVKAVESGKLYGQADPEFTATVSGTLNNDKISYTVSRPGAGTDEEVKKYEDAIVAAGDARQGNYSVSYVPADFTISINNLDLGLTAENGGGEYNANPYYLENVAATGGAAGGSKIEYKVGDGEWSEEVPSRTDAGTLEGISVRVSKAGYETKVIEKLKIEVTPKPVTVKAVESGKLYGQADPEFTATVSGTLNNDKISYTVSRPGAGTDEEVKKYEDAIVAAGDARQGNYSVSYVPADFTISINNLDLGLTAENGGGEYNANPYYLENVAATGGAAGGSKIEYKVGDGEWSEEVPSRTDAGTLEGISVRVSKAGYETVQIDGLKIEVTPKPVTVTATDSGKLYGQADPEFTATVSGTLNNDKISYTVSRPGAGTDEEVKTYEDAIVAAGEARQGNYSVSYVPADFTIRTNNVDLGLTAENGGGEYNANPYYLDECGRRQAEQQEGSKIEYKVGDGEWSEEAPSRTDAGTLEGISVRVSKAGYETKVIEKLKIEVTPKPVTVKAVESGKLYGQADPEFTATVSGTLNNDKISYTVSRPGAGTDEEVKKYEDAIVAAGDARQGNYSVSYVPADFTISINNLDLGLTAENGGGEYNANPYYLENVAGDRRSRRRIQDRVQGRGRRMERGSTEPDRCRNT